MKRMQKKLFCELELLSQRDHLCKSYHPVQEMEYYQHPFYLFIHYFHVPASEKNMMMIPISNTIL